MLTRISICLIFSSAGYKLNEVLIYNVRVLLLKSYTETLTIVDIKTILGRHTKQHQKHMMCL